MRFERFGTVRPSRPAASRRRSKQASSTHPPLSATPSRTQLSLAALPCLLALLPLKQQLQARHVAACMASHAAVLSR